MRTAYLISNIEEYGKFIAFCIDNDISVFRTYWDKREKGNRCYEINREDKRCYYASKQYWMESGYAIKTPKFELNEYGEWKLIEE